MSFSFKDSIKEKWNYYLLSFIIITYTIFLLISFIYGVILANDPNNKIITITQFIYFIISIVLGFSFFTIEVRKFIYNIN